jgi:hypothetical protein
LYLWHFIPGLSVLISSGEPLNINSLTSAFFLTTHHVSLVDSKTVSSQKLTFIATKYLDMSHGTRAGLEWYRQRNSQD